MHKLFLGFLAMSVTFLAGAETPKRSLHPTGGNIKQINTQSHFTSTSATSPIFRALPDDAPENAIEVPFSHDMGKNSEKVDVVKKYTTINANNDNREWQVAKVNDYSACMAPNADGIDADDDWLITVPLYMPSGNYVISFDLGYLGTSATGVTMAVNLGTAATVEAMTTEIAPTTTFTTKDKTTYSYNCTIATDGYYYLGFHCLTTKAQSGAVRLYNISVKAGEVKQVDPPAAGELTWELAPNGELKATVTYTAPTKTRSGADLTAISKVELTSRWGVDKFTYDDVQPGQQIVQEVEMYAGINNRFTGVAYVDDVAGDIVEYKSIFCGPDTPLAPTNVKLTPSSDYKSATLTWDAVGSVGENGGYVNPDEVTYYVFDAFGSYYDPAIAETNETSISISYPDLESQDFVAYQVTAGYKDNYSLDTASDIVIVGEPATLPFTESFTNGRYDGIWCLDTDTSYSGQQYGTIDDSYFESLLDPDDPESPAPLKSQDGDNGFYYWFPMTKDVMWGMMSVRAEISTAENPVLEFWYQGQGSTIDVLLASGTEALAVKKTISLKTEPTSGWTLAQIPLGDYKSAGTVNFEIRLTATDNDDSHTWSVPLDNISIRDLVATDLRVVTASFPSSSAKVGDKLSMSARIENQGSQQTAATVNLLINDTLIESKDLGMMEPYTFNDVAFEYTVPLNSPEQLNVKLVAVAQGDAVESNNSVEHDINIKYAPFASVTDLTATPADDGNSVTLTWTAPVNETVEPETITDDFESEDYVAMSITGAGDWTVFDGDETRTINLFYEAYNPYQTMAMAFQLFNREVAEVSSTYWEDAAPHSGNTFMVAPTAYYAENDNWLISPELSGREQTISFYAKSFSSAWPESFEVYYSTTDNTRASFTADHILNVENYPSNNEVPEVWTEYKATLPAGAKYFAIHHNPYYTYALLVDDVTYEAKSSIPEDLAVTGYHILRDGAQLTNEPVVETTFTDNFEMADDVVYTYTVVPVYNAGIAKGSDTTVSIHRSGIETVVIDKLDSTDIIYDLRGIAIPKSKLTPGLYIRVNNGNAQKVMLK
jgi:hypothetical protein